MSNCFNLLSTGYLSLEAHVHIQAASNVLILNSATAGDLAKPMNKQTDGSIHDERTVGLNTTTRNMSHYAML